MVVGEHVRSSPRGHDGDCERFRKGHEALRGACSQHPTSRDDDPTLGAGEQLDDATHCGALRSRSPCGREWRHSLIRDLDLGGLDILRDSDEDGSGPTGAEASMGLGHDRGGLIGFIDLGSPCGQ